MAPIMKQVYDVSILLTGCHQPDKLSFATEPNTIRLVETLI